jgi:hypothetical protein
MLLTTIQQPYTAQWASQLRGMEANSLLAISLGVEQLPHSTTLLPTLQMRICRRAFQDGSHGIAIMGEEGRGLRALFGGGRAWHVRNAPNCIDFEVIDILFWLRLMSWSCHFVCSISQNFCLAFASAIHIPLELTSW